MGEKKYKVSWKRKIKNLSKRVEILEKQIKEDKEDMEVKQKKLQAELDYAKFRCALLTEQKARMGNDKNSM